MKELIDRLIYVTQLYGAHKSTGYVKQHLSIRADYHGIRLVFEKENVLCFKIIKHLPVYLQNFLLRAIFDENQIKKQYTPFIFLILSHEIHCKTIEKIKEVLQDTKHSR